MVRQIVITVILFSSLSCSKEVGKFCSVSDPVTELTWLADLIKEAVNMGLQVKVEKVVFKEREGLAVLNKRQDGFEIEIGQLTWLYNCSGDEKCMCGGVVYDENCCDEFKVIKNEVIFQNY